MRILSFVGLTMIAASATAQAQQPVMSPSAVLALPSSAARTLTPGETRTSALLATDGMLSDSSHFGRWQFEGKRGQRATVTMRSDAFDTYLLLGKQGAEAIAAENDDSEGTNSEVAYTLPDDGTYVIIARSFAAKETGEYSLTLALREPLPGMSGPVTPSTVLLREADPMQRLGVDRRMGSQLDTRDAKMDDSTHFELWYVNVNAGDQLRVTLESTQFSGALFVAPQGGREVPTGAVGQRPSVDFTAQAAGTLVIIVKGNSTADRGSYMLDIARRPVTP